MSDVTLRPWIMRSMQDHCDADGDATDYEIVGANNETIADDQTYYPTAPTAANAAHIVKAVNMHDRFLKLCKELQTVIAGNDDLDNLIAEAEAK